MEKASEPLVTYKIFVIIVLHGSSIIVHSEKDNKDWYSLCGRWLNNKNGQLREIPMLDKVERLLNLLSLTKSLLLPEIITELEHTNVFIQIFGDKNSSSKRQIQNSDNNFKWNKTDVFGFSLVDLGELQKYVHEVIDCTKNMVFPNWEMV